MVQQFQIGQEGGVNERGFHRRNQAKGNSDEKRGKFKEMLKIGVGELDAIPERRKEKNVQYELKEARLLTQILPCFFKRPQESRHIKT